MYRYLEELMKLPEVYAQEIGTARDEGLPINHPMMRQLEAAKGRIEAELHRLDEQAKDFLPGYRI